MKDETFRRSKGVHTQSEAVPISMSQDLALKNSLLWVHSAHVSSLTVSPKRFKIVAYQNPAQRRYVLLF